MKTFKQYCESVQSISLTKDDVLRFTNSPYKFQVVPSLFGLIKMSRHIDRSRSCLASFYIDRNNNNGAVKNYVIDYIEYPFIYSIAAAANPLYKENIVSLFHNIEYNVTEGNKDLFAPYRYHPTDNVIFRDIQTYFEIYNVYEDTPGSEIEKAIAVAQFCGMDRGRILKLKYKYGLLKSTDELSDKDTLDLF